eukprot:11200104-Lingulodinium_polyedra.AAC.1
MDIGNAIGSAEQERPDLSKKVDELRAVFRAKGDVKGFHQNYNQGCSQPRPPGMGQSCDRSTKVGGEGKG